MRCLHVMPENGTRVRYLDWALMWTHRFFDVQVQTTAGACVHTFPVSSEVIHCFAYPAITFCYCSHFKIASEKAKWRKVTYWVPCRAMCRFPITDARSSGVNSTLGRHWSHVFLSDWWKSRHKNGLRWKPNTTASLGKLLFKNST